MSSATKKVAYNTVVQVISRVIITAISLVAIAYLTRYLGVSGYGQYTLIFAYLALLGVAVDFGFFLLQVREVTRHPGRESYVLGNVMGLKIALSLVVFGVGYILATAIYSDTTVQQGVLIGVLSQTALALLQVPISLFQARLQMRKVAIANIITRTVYLGLILWAVKNDLGLIGVLWVTAAANILALVGQWAWAMPLASLTPRWDFIYWFKFLREAWPLGVVTVVAMIYFKVDTVMLSMMKDSYAVGIYGAPYKVIEVLLTIPTIFMSSVFPVITQALTESRERAMRVFRKAFDAMSLVAWPLAIGTMMVATPLMTAIAGADFAVSGAPLKLLIWAAALSFVGATLNYSVIAAGRQSILVWPYLLATIFNIVTNWIFIPRYSYMGAAATTVATELLVVIYVAVVVYKELRFTPQWDVFLKAILGAVVMGGLLWWLGSANILINLGAGVVSYGLVLVTTRAVPKEVFKELFGR
ncbi:MAG: polysaccharide biosynthesis protein [candidate division Kazan bacterium GW2011_GWA1_50_15]|uniref:Polysaccharide biosynthesis protein n=2 Tax=Bacteria division Kazan-3B-28 TaxID=1798534 RepID=A0A0G2A4P4_UNCK3|nr:MAG: polysaccharide biosynthesis protein [candidate division Kazan bacterium GW2011_GWA1_50_15]KKW25776.1 MAG: Polysaccharide biosynthesis protein [candidate division Kazan bacterium GW2011_GWC1_52_13]KKW27209.1 MAG: Polysaccharide biosynthesis protein [candidate division Kazan bacterium GW2011_GWB1_52_7]HCR42500.1 hypothetical protein [Patescibacteria group bacterium]